MNSKLMHQLESGILSQEAAAFPEQTSIRSKVSPGGTEIHVYQGCHRRWGRLPALCFYWTWIDGHLSWNIPTLCSEVHS